MPNMTTMTMNRWMMVVVDSKPVILELFFVTDNQLFIIFFGGDVRFITNQATLGGAA